MVDSSKPVIALTQKELQIEREEAKLEVAVELARRGMSADTLATITGIKLESINRVIIRSKLTPQEEDIAEMARKVMSKSLMYALETLDNGSPQAKFAIMNKMLGPASRLIGRGESGTAEIEQALATILEMQRKGISEAS